MPLITHSNYSPPAWLRNGHALTLWAALCRQKPILPPGMVRERLITPDHDFVDVDYTPASPDSSDCCKRAVILSHGLEGHSRRRYMLGMSAAFLAAGWDVFARNLRACSGEINCTPRMYHSGETDDLDLVVNHVLVKGYSRLALIGFSLGGNQTLRYLAEQRLPTEVCAAVTISVPCDLAGSAAELSKPSRSLYMAYFMRSLKKKIRHKHGLHPEHISLRGLSRMYTFQAFDDAYTAPLHGFASARDYWARASSLPVLQHIRVPTLLLNAKDDPFLSPSCYPTQIAAAHPSLHLETPVHGGHVGFVSPQPGPYWDEERAVEFVGENFLSPSERSYLLPV